MPDINTLRETLKQSDRYQSFTLLNEPLPFSTLYKDRDLEVVQLHSIEFYEKEILGFCGIFSWEDNILSSIDGDLYTEKMLVYGYNEWSNEDTETGLDILVLEW